MDSIIFILVFTFGVLGVICIISGLIQRSKKRQMEAQAATEAKLAEARAKLRAIQEEKEAQYAQAQARVREVMLDYEKDGMTELDAFHAAVNYVRDSEGLDYMELRQFWRDMARETARLTKESKARLEAKERAMEEERGRRKAEQAAQQQAQVQAKAMVDELSRRSITDPTFRSRMKNLTGADKK